MLQVGVELRDDLVRLALAEGALDAWPADPAKLPMRAWARLQCRFGCPDHGREVRPGGLSPSSFGVLLLA